MSRTTLKQDVQETADPPRVNWFVSAIRKECISSSPSRAHKSARWVFLLSLLCLTVNFLSLQKSMVESVLAPHTNKQQHKHYVHIGLAFTVGGSNCSNTAKLDLIEKTFHHLVTSLHYSLSVHADWKISLIFTNDGLSCLDWNQYEKLLFSSDIDYDYSSDRLQALYSFHNVNQGIRNNTEQAFRLLEDLRVDYFVNLEDDMLCRKSWLNQLYDAYMANKHENNVALIATGYNSVLFDPMENLTCTPTCVWKRLVYGPNYFFDNTTYHQAVKPAFSDHYTAWKGKRPGWLASNPQAWDNFVLDEYYTALKRVATSTSVPPGVLVLKPSVLQHQQRNWTMHPKARDFAIDFSQDDENSTEY